MAASNTGIPLKENIRENDLLPFEKMEVTHEKTS